MNNGQANTSVNPLAPAMMATYASLMKQFLDVQRDVMIAALQSGDFDAEQLMSLSAVSAPPPVLTTPVVTNGYQPAAVTAVAPPPAPAIATNGNGQHAAVPAPAAVAPPPAPAKAAPAPSGDVSEETIRDALLDIVAERTGYPPEMIELDLDLEADLGIDSIKRIEILGSFQEQFGDLVDPALMDDMTQQKSLGDIIAFIMANKA